jgi:hypothetical protein
MFHITKPSANRLDIEIKGSLDTETMRTALDELIAQSGDIRKGLMLYTITAFSLPTLGAIGVELSRLPKLLSLIGKFERCAVLSDAQWLRTAAAIEGALIPGLAIKSFELDERAAAEAWLQAGTS